MAVIQKIRNSYGKIAGGVIAIALISFIVSDATTGSFGKLFGGNKTDVITVNGTTVESKEYEQRVKEYEILTNIYSNRGPLDDAARAQLREEVLRSVTYEAVVNKLCDKLGIEISDAEKKDLIYGNNAHPLVRQFNIEGQQVFNNPETKQFDPARVKGIEDEIAKNGAKVDPSGKFTEGWTAVKAYVLRMARVDKFNNMMGAGIYVPLFAAKRDVDNQGMMAAIRYVKVPYASIPDGETKVTDEDIKAFMQKHKAMYETDQATRNIEYVAFDIVPSSADSGRATGALEEMKAEFATAKDDKTFVGNKSDEPNLYNEAFVNKKTFLSRYADTIMGQPVGTIYGPYLENGSFRISKVVDKKTLPDSVKVRHILINVNDGRQAIMPDSMAKRKIDSIAAAIAAGASFDTMVVKMSQAYNPQNPDAAKGELNMTLQQMPQIEAQLSKDFTKFVLEGHVGERKVIKSDNSKTNGFVGYQYVEIMEQKGVSSTAKIATIAKSLLPSDSTVNALFAKANEFTSKSTSAAEFDATAKKMGVDKRAGENLKENTFTIQGLGAAREIIKWAFNHKVGDVSPEPFNMNGQRYVIAKLVSVEEKGLMGITPANRPMLEARVRDEKKAEKILAKYKGASLESIGTAVASPVQQSDSVMLGAAYIPGLGYEPKVVGYTFCSSFQPNTVSPGIKGQGGVYFISVISRTAKPAMDPMSQQMALMQGRRQQEGQLRNYFGQLLQTSIIKNADIKYNVNNF